MRIPKIRRVTRFRGLYRALVATARQLGYEYRLIDGINGYHFGYTTAGDNRRIEIGRDLTLTAKIIILSHEIGHALDHIHDPPGVKELLEMLVDWEAFKLTPQYYEREKTAWLHGKNLLEQMGGYSAVRSHFTVTRRNCLRRYYYRMRKYAGRNTTADIRRPRSM